MLFVQSLLDEQRNTRVSTAVLHTLVQASSGFAPRLGAAILKAAGQLGMPSELATSGSTTLLEAAEPSMRTSSCVYIPPHEVPAGSMLACGSLDVVALVRHNGLPSATSPYVGCVRFPEDGGLLCASTRLRSDACHMPPVQYPGWVQVTLVFQVPLFVR